MTYLTKQIQQNPTLTSRLLNLALISLVLMTLQTAWPRNCAAQNTFPSSGNVGIGTTSPNVGLEVKTTGAESGIRIAGPGGVRLDLHSTNGSSPARNWAMRIDDWVFGDFAIFQSNAQGGDPFLAGTARFYIHNNGNVGIGTTSPTVKLHVVGDGKLTGSLTVDGSINSRYQDVAEWVPARFPLAAATVVTLDPTKSNHVEASSKAYDTRVAGVISAQPGITLGESGGGKVLVATTGRVRIKVDASQGPIMVGDLLVTSDRAGMAMKSQPISLGGVQIHRPGTLIGKALEPLAKGTGEILVLLSLQ